MSSNSHLAVPMQEVHPRTKQERQVVSRVVCRLLAKKLTQAVCTRCLLFLSLKATKSITLQSFARDRRLKRDKA